MQYNPEILISSRIKRDNSSIIVGVIEYTQESSRIGKNLSYPQSYKLFLTTESTEHTEKNQALMRQMPSLRTLTLKLIKRPILQLDSFR